jgi:hypothetical protein
MSALTQLDDRACRRIVSTAALLTSPQDGERLAASRGLERLLAPHGLSLTDLVRRALLGEALRRLGPAERIFPLHHRMARMCLAQSGCINDWDRSFLNSVLSQERLSAKQKATLDSIVAKIDQQIGGQDASH